MSNISINELKNINFSRCSAPTLCNDFYCILVIPVLVFFNNINCMSVFNEFNACDLGLQLSSNLRLWVSRIKLPIQHKRKILTNAMSTAELMQWRCGLSYLQEVSNYHTTYQTWEWPNHHRPTMISLFFHQQNWSLLTEARSVNINFHLNFWR